MARKKRLTEVYGVRTTRAQKRPTQPGPRGPKRSKFVGVPNDQIVSATFEMTRNERTRLNWIAEGLGMSATDLVRAWIREGRAPGPGEELE